MKITEKELIQLKEQYKPGTRVELISMDDPYCRIMPGEKGTVRLVDDIGTIHVNWDCGIGLGMVYREDNCKVIS